MSEVNARSESAAPIARVAVCALTFKRPHGLARLLNGFSRLSTPNIEPIIVIVDNDPARSGEAQVTEWARSAAWPTRYACQPQRGIAHARNMALETALTALADARNGAARDEWIAFIDDDEAPHADWLEQLWAAARRFRADVVTGPVEAAFEEPAPKWVLHGRFFERQRYASGAARPYAFTNNVLMRAAIPAGGLRFDSRFVLNVGEDRHFFEIAARDGARIVWCDEAVVTEWNPPARVNPTWLIERMRRVGRSTSLVELALREGLGTRARLWRNGLAWWAIGMAQAVPAIWSGMVGRVRAARSRAYGRGLIEGLMGRIS
ncbi:MAG: glycosyltransferase family 2 protein [Phycisphaerales bacterium]|nr:glycosyltransferase family 2 protein [Phycisphaerales bacterium]